MSEHTQVPVVFPHGLTIEKARESLIRMFEETKEESSVTIVFLGIPPSFGLVEVVKTILNQNKGRRVVIRDIYDVEGTDEEVEARGGLDWEVRQAIKDLRSVASVECKISTPTRHRSTADLVHVSEFRAEKRCRSCGLSIKVQDDSCPASDHDQWTDSYPSTVIVADASPDGLLAAMKAVGITYPELESDAVVFSGPESQWAEEDLSELGVLLVQVLAAVPYSRPDLRHRGRTDAFVAFSRAAEGDKKARKALLTREGLNGQRYLRKDFVPTIEESI